MALSAGVVSAGFALAGLGMLGFLRKPFDRPGKPGSTGFAVTVVGISLWSLSLAANYATASESLSYAAYGALMLSTSLTGVGWFLLAVEFTNRRRLSRGLVLPLAAFVVAEQLLFWTNDVHQLFLGPGTAMDGAVLVADYGPGFWGQAAVNYGLIALATGLLAHEWVRSSGLRRRQTGLLVLASVPAMIANVANVFGSVSPTYDVSPIGFLASGLLLALGLYRAEFLDVVPIARQTAMEEMADAVVTVDGDDRVVDCNGAARRMFDVADDFVGRPVAELFAPVIGDQWARLASASDVETHVTATIDGERRHFSLVVSTVEVGEDSGIGRVFVWRDVTALMRQEQALEARERKVDLLRQVMSRVLRHNLRNELTIVQGNADLIASQVDDAAVDDHVQSIRSASDDLLAISEKARTIERIVDTDVELVDLDLRDVAETAARDVGARYPDVTVEVEGSGACRVRASPDLGIAVENLVENAAEYNDASEPYVSVSASATGDGAALTVADNGPGIPDAEVAVLDAGRETPLNHGSGIGLWLVSWIVGHSGASLSFDSDDGGTEVRIEFDDLRVSAEEPVSETESSSLAR